MYQPVHGAVMPYRKHQTNRYRSNRYKAWTDISGSTDVGSMGGTGYK